MNKENNVVKICVPSTGEGLESQIDPRFGRCKYFTLIEIENGKILNIKSEKNIGAEQSSGAGIAAAEKAIELGANVVLASDVGPKSKEILDQLGVKIVKASGIIKDAVDEYINKSI